MRTSFFVACVTTSLFSVTDIERNFHTLILRPSKPYLSCLKMIGPLEVTLTAKAIAMSKGDISSKIAAETIISSVRFINSRAPIKGDSNTLNVSSSPTCSIRACIKFETKKSGIMCTSTVVSPNCNKISAMRLSAFIGSAIYKTPIDPFRAASTASRILPATSCLSEFSNKRSGFRSS